MEALGAHFVHLAKTTNNTSSQSRSFIYVALIQIFSFWTTGGGVDTSTANRKKEQEQTKALFCNGWHILQKVKIEKYPFAEDAHHAFFCFPAAVHSRPHRGLRGLGRPSGPTTL